MLSTRRSVFLSRQLMGSASVCLGMMPSRSFSSPAVRRHKKKQANSSVPSLDIAKSMPRSFSEMDNNVLMCVAAMESHLARVEVLKRHIMAVDNVAYEEASKTFDLIAAKNREGMWIDALPYTVGIGLASTAAAVSLPMVFDLTTAIWFNEFYVTTDVPEARDLETPLEVGAWTWNWMEPPLGTFSFALLCLQFSRAQLQNLGIKPYTSWLREKRAKKVAASFPKYDADIIHLFSETDPMVRL